jgi:FkbM family methyltransferase
MEESDVLVDHFSQLQERSFASFSNVLLTTDNSPNAGSPEIQTVNGLKNGIRNMARPVVHMARRLLEPTPPTVVLGWHTIEAGPAEGCEILLPYPSGFADKIIPGQYEILTAEVMSALVSRDSICFDIGGHYGYFTLVLAKLATGGRVETFEPVPSHAQRIADSAVRSGLSHVTVHRKAVADIESTMTLRYASSGNYDSMGYLDSFGGVVSDAATEQYPHFESIDVETTTLDQLSSLRPDFIKIDAEGAEGAVLRGGLKLLAGRPVRLLVEVHGVRQAFECADVLRQIGYRALLIGPQGSTLSVLFISHQDQSAVEAVSMVLGGAPTVIFDTQSKGSV